ncbi:DUF1641 domain-containing protein [Cryptosporangium sp. NPDC051539]|uniref:DUF1641 domain-containing protein n=1 Tax=Cryptosporangium sp. NPDC051539 TaxID=3363962 RepID=UPI00378AFA3F
MTADLSRPSSLDSVLCRLDEPKVADALNTILDHADLIAVAVVAIDGLMRRSEQIGEALADGVGELRELAAAQRAEHDLDPRAVAGSLVELARVLPTVAPALSRIAGSGLIDTVLDSGITSPPMIEQISRMGRGLTAAAAQHQANPEPLPTGVFGLLKLLKDPDVSRGAGFMVAALREIGRELDEKKG